VAAPAAGSGKGGLGGGSDGVRFGPRARGCPNRLCGCGAVETDPSSGDRVKTDARDAAHLTRLLRLGAVTPATVPDQQVEAVRDLVRAREDARADLMRVRHRLSKLLLRQGRIYSGGQARTGLHEIWLRRQRFDDAHVAAAFDHHFDAVLTTTAVRDRLDEQIGGQRSHGPRTGRLVLVAGHPELTRPPRA
jgi:transposase